MRDKNCFNCGNDYACVDCICFNKWQTRPENRKVEPFYINYETPEKPFANGYYFKNIATIFDKIDLTFYKRG